MQLTHAFTVPVGPDEAWTVLRDIARIGPCMPGATIESVSGEDFTGRVKVKVGPITVTYKGKATFVDVDEVAHRARIEASGKETRGSGTAQATITAECREAEPGRTQVTLITDLAVTGKPAQFGRGVMADVGTKLVGRFADCLSEQLAAGEPEPAAAAASLAAGGPAGSSEGAGVAHSSAGEARVAPDSAASADPAAAPGTPEAERLSTSAAPGRPADQRSVWSDRPGAGPVEDTIDLFEVAGDSVARRAAPLAAAALAGALIAWLLTRRRRRA